MIAQDVLAQIATKNIIPRSGTWIATLSHWNDSNNLEIAKCFCCGVGALLKSACNQSGAVKNNVSLFAMHEQLDPYFPKNEQRLIELAFERGLGTYNAHSDEEVDAAEMFDSSVHATTRMTVIMKNIIKNKGQFTPTRYYEEK